MLESYPDLLTLKQVEQILNIKRYTSLRLVTENEIAAFKIGRGWLISKQSLIDYIENRLNERRG